MSEEKPRGAPRSGEHREKLKSVTFKLDAETDAALTRLEVASGLSAVRGRRSQLIRRLILEAAKQASPERPKKISKPQ